MKTETLNIPNFGYRNERDAEMNQSISENVKGFIDAFAKIEPLIKENEEAFDYYKRGFVTFPVRKSFLSMRRSSGPKTLIMKTDYGIQSDLYIDRFPPMFLHKKANIDLAWSSPDLYSYIIGEQRLLFREYMGIPELSNKMYVEVYVTKLIMHNFDKVKIRNAHYIQSSDMKEGVELIVRFFSSFRRSVKNWQVYNNIYDLYEIMPLFYLNTEYIVIPISHVLNNSRLLEVCPILARPALQLLDKIVWHLQLPNITEEVHDWYRRYDSDYLWHAGKYFFPYHWYKVHGTTDTEGFLKQLLGHDRIHKIAADHPIYVLM